MKKLLLALAFLLAPVAANAQCTGVFQPGTICGNSGASPAPPKQDTPGNFTVTNNPLITRAQIPSTHIAPVTDITLIGYRTAQDLGYGAHYTRTGATSTGLMAIQDADGNWWNLVLSGRANVGWFGAFGDGGSHQISSGDISANPQWRGTYTAGKEWDYVASQEAIYAAFATASTPGVISWNNINLITSTNSEFFVPNGNYSINATVYAVTQDAKLTWGTGRGAAFWTRTGSQTIPMLLCDSCDYTQFYQPAMQDENTASYGSVFPLWQFDHTPSSPGGLKTQQVTIYDALIFVGINGQGVTFNPVSQSGGQGDTVIWINPIFVGNLSDFGLQLWGDNTLSMLIYGGDIQGFQHDGIQNQGGSIQTYGTHFENENFNGVSYTPIFSQWTTYGADMHTYGGVGSEQSGIHYARSESSTLSISDAQPTEVDNSFVAAPEVSVNGWFANYPHLPGIVVQGGATTTREFMVVDGQGTPQWKHMNTTGGTVSTVTDPTASYTVNQWVGYSFFFRFGSNGFTQHCDITANTATTITVNCSVGPVASDSLYIINGKSGNSPPNWDSATNGLHSEYLGNHQGVATQAGTNQVAFSSSINPQIGDYFVIPLADKVDTGTIVTPAAFIAKVTAVSAGSCGFISGYTSCATVSKAPAFTLTNVIGYTGTPITDGQLSWINLGWEAIGFAQQITNTHINAGQVNGQNLQSSGLSGARFDIISRSGGSGAGEFPKTINFDSGNHLSIQPSIGVQSGTVDLTQSMNSSNFVEVQPTGDITFTTTAPAFSGQGFSQFFTIILGGTNSAFNITFGSGFNSNGPLRLNNSLGGDHAWAITFVLGTFQGGFPQWNEVGRSPILGNGTQNARTTSTFSKTSDTTLANIPGLSATVLPGDTYQFVARLYISSLAAAGGTQVAIGGTATATSIVYSGSGFDSGSPGSRGYAQATSLGSPVASATAWSSTNPTLEIQGTITVNAGGTLTVQFAQNTSNGIASVVGTGSTFNVTKVP